MFFFISGNIRQRHHKQSTFGAYSTPLIPKAQGIKALKTQVKETRPKGPKVGHSKPTRPKQGRAKLARAYKRLELETKADQDHPESRSTQSSRVGSSRERVLLTSSCFRMSIEAFSMGGAISSI